MLRAIPEIREREVMELMRRPDHMVNAESFMIEGKGIAIKFPDVKIELLNLTEDRLLKIANNVEFFSQNNLVGSYMSALEDSYRYEVESAYETLILIEARARVAYRIHDLKKRLDFIAGGLRAKELQVAEAPIFTGGEHVARMVYAFR